MIVTYIMNGVVLIAAIMLAVIYTRAYLQAPPEGSWYTKLWDALMKSWTVTWGAFVVVATKTLDTSGSIADMISAGAGDQIKAAVPAQYLAAVTMGITVIFILARLRTLFNK